MKIGIDLRAVTFGASGGIAQYLQGMLRAAFAQNPQDQFVVFCTIFSRSVIGQAPANVTIETIPGFRFYQRIDEAAATGAIDVLFRSYPMEAPLNAPWEKQIVLIPDLQHDVYPEFYTPEVLRLRRLAFNRALMRAAALVAFTQYVRGTILEHPWALCRDVFLSAPALTLGHELPGALRPEEEALIPKEDFFLYPANLWPHKNHRRVLQALDRFLQRSGRTMRMIFTGHPQGWDPLRDEFAGLPVTHLGYVREPVMQALMARAKALTFFSLHEGFGIPLLEAFAAGTPVICANTTSLPEVGGDAALSCDPTDVEAIAQLMQRILCDCTTRQELIQRGKTRLPHYTWEAAAAGFMEACRHTAGAGRRSSIRVTQPPLVSIVTPSFNQGRFLKATIDSVLAQAYPHIQYIVIDGGSSDDSVNILKSYGDRFFWKSQKDKGQSDAINKGMALAKGDILAFLNSDDLYLPGAVERAVAHFRDHFDCDLVYGRANYIDADGNDIGMYRTDEYNFRRLVRDCCICQPAAFWRARVVRLVGGLDPALHCALDFDYWLRIDRAGGRIQHIHDVLACSRLHADAKTLAIRRRFYREIFAVSLKNAGFVDYNYFLGLWHHLVTESPQGWPRFFKWIPHAYVPMAWVHHKVFEYKLRGSRQWTTQMLGGAIGQAAKLPLAGGTLARGLRALKSTLTRPKVSGFFSDNWMHPHSRIIVHPKASGQRLRHIGRAPMDMRVTVQINQDVLREYRLRGGTVQAIGEDITLDHDEPVELKFHFSGHTVDSAKRKLAFLVTETNLFGEDDLA
ncbi:MAG: glycosyltransferase [Tepidisphaeraceae bacterium]|jgi:glycosyltransferase involved in cell wall biosynthesis